MAPKPRLNFLTTTMIKLRAGREIRWLGFAALLAFGTGCGSESWEGTYDTTQTVNVAGPLADGRTVADAMVDLVVSEAVERSPLPAKDTLKELLAGVVLAPAKAELERSLPPDWQAEGRATKALRSSLATVRFQSELTLEEGGVFSADVLGNETVTGIQFLDLPTQPTLNLDNRLLTATWQGSDEGDHLKIEPHPLAIQYSELVIFAANLVLGPNAFTDLDGYVTKNLDCKILVLAMLGGKQTLDFELLGQTVSVDSNLLADGCNAARDKLSERASKALFEVPIVVGGNLALGPENGDEQNRTLSSQAGYGGHVRVLPPAIAPKISARLDATRK